MYKVKLFNKHQDGTYIDRLNKSKRRDQTFGKASSTLLGGLLGSSIGHGVSGGSRLGRAIGAGIGAASGYGIGKGVSGLIGRSYDKDISKYKNSDEKSKDLLRKKYKEDRHNDMYGGRW